MIDIVIHLINIGLDAILQGRFAISSGSPAFLDRLGIIMLKRSLVGKDLLD